MISDAASPHPGMAHEPGIESWSRYWADARWRLLATMDLLRQRGDNMLDHEAAGMPLLLHFDAQPVGNARDFAAP
jgi:hypothetical protein